MNLTEFTPKIFTVLKQGYSKTDLRSDLIAGLTVAIVALPLAMALAIASGTSPDKGLVTAIVAGFLISFLGGSRVQIGGPTGAFVVVVFNIIAVHGFDGLVLATLMAGIMLIVAGYTRMGQIIKYIPHPVITGFTAGIAVIIASSQVKDFLGLRMENVPADFVQKWIAYFGEMSNLNIISTCLALSALLSILLIRRYAPKLPGYLIAVILCSAIVWVFHLPVETIGSRFPNIPTGLPMPSMPEFSFTKIQEVLPAAFTIAFLAGIEALLSAIVADGMTGYKHRSNQELVAQGIANVASAFFAGLPATGAIARTATNVKSGGKSPVAGMFHAVCLLLFVYFAMDIVSYIPMAALAAILFVVAWGMSEMHHFVHIFKISKSDRIVLVLTFALTVFVDLTVAIGVGVTLASLLFMRQMSQHVQISTNKNKEEVVDDETQREDLPVGVEAFKINGPLFFGVASNIIETLNVLGQVPRVLILRMKLVPYLDATGETAIERLISECKKKGIKLIISTLQKQPEKTLKNGGIVDGKDGVIFASSYEEALQMAKKLVKKKK